VSVISKIAKRSERGTMSGAMSRAPRGALETRHAGCSWLGAASIEDAYPSLSSHLYRPGLTIWVTGTAHAVRLSWRTLGSCASI
jgi:hypothetical protein